LGGGDLTDKDAADDDDDDQGDEEEDSKEEEGFDDLDNPRDSMDMDKSSSRDPGGTTLGDGSDTLFWQDRWLHGQRIADLTPRLLAAVPKDRINKCTVQEALCANKWVSDIRGAITVGVMVEYLQLWEVLLNVELQPGHQDTHFWRFTANKRYSAKVAYEGLFWGSVEFEHYEQVW
jgi:hypothetical protein